MKHFQSTNLARQAGVVALAACLAAVQASAALPIPPESAHAEEVKAALEKAGANRRIEVSLSDGERLHGRVSAFGKQTFTFLPDHHGASREIPYEQVARIRPGSGKLIWISLGVIAAAVVIVIVALARTPSVHSSSM